MRHWMGEGMQQPPQLMGRLLYSLTGPPALEKAIQELNEEFREGV